MNLLRQLLTDDRWLAQRRGLLGIIWVTLVIMTHIPVPQAVQGLGVSDKLIHLVGYFPLGLLLPVCRVPGCETWWRCLIVIAIYGILDELFQIPVGRTASVLDWIADVLGILLGLMVSRMLTKPLA
jgi:VanZ family protein